MNAKKCKQLRREARAIASLAPERQLDEDWTPRRTKTLSNATVSVRSVYRLKKKKAANADR